MKCGDCGAKMVKKTVKADGRVFLGCTRYPICRGTHSLHQDTHEPMGIPADAATRLARKEAHAEVDKLWLHHAMSRREVYRELGEHLGIPPEECHIGRFDLALCDLAKRWARRRAKERQRERKRARRENIRQARHKQR